MIELPWRCRKCHQEQMVDMESLESWPLDNLTTARGFTCGNCGSREVISYTTPLLEEELERLVQMRPTHRKFFYRFAKAVRRAESINRRNYGTRGHLYLVATG